MSAPKPPGQHQHWIDVLSDDFECRDFSRARETIAYSRAELADLKAQLDYAKATSSSATWNTTTTTKHLHARPETHHHVHHHYAECQCKQEVEP